MKGMKQVVESAVVLCVAGALAITAATSSDYVSGNTEGTQAAIMEDFMVAMDTESENLLSIEKSEVNRVTSSLGAEEAEMTDTEESAADENEGLMSLDALENLEYTQNLGMTEAEQQWKGSLMNKTGEPIAVYKEADENSKEVGKLRKTDVAVVKQTSATWTLIESGNLIGYVKNENCVYGLEAMEYASENCKTIATSKVRNLRVREEQSTKSAIVESLAKGDTIEVDTKAATEEGWIAVKYDGQTCYISAEYAEISDGTTTALTAEEQKEAEEKAKKEEAAKKAKSSKYNYDSTVTQGEAVEYDVDDLTLLATIIDCEAGAECYDAQLGCGAVIMNRVKSSKYPDTIAGVVYQRGQFGPVSNGSLERKFRTGASESCYRAAREALAGVDNTDGCLYFNGVMYTNRSGLRMGDTVFWKVW